MTHDTIQAWISDVWSRLRMAIEADARRSSGHTVTLPNSLNASVIHLGLIIILNTSAPSRCFHVKGLCALLCTNLDTHEPALSRHLSLCACACTCILYFCASACACILFDRHPDVNDASCSASCRPVTHGSIGRRGSHVNITGRRSHD